MNLVKKRSTAQAREENVGESMWSKAAYKFRRDRTGMMGLYVVVLYMLVALGGACGLWGTEWSDNNGQKWEGISFQYWFGTNILGQDIFERAVFSTKTAFEVGVKRDRSKRARNVQKRRLGHPRCGFFQPRGVGGCKGVGTFVWVARR